MAPVDVCKYNQTVFCKYRQQCRKQHIHEICTTFPCTNNMCFLRHPRICKYYSEFGRCKFGDSCLYLHTNRFLTLENDIGILKSEIEELKRKNTELENLVNKLNREELQKLDKRATRNTSGPVLLNYSSATTIPSTLTNVNLAFLSESNQQIPQLDGGLHQDSGCVSVSLQHQIQCESCHEIFDSQDDLTNHIEKYEYTCEDCELCFLSEYEHDIHEHAVHPLNYYKYNAVSPRTKQKAIQCLTNS